MVDRATAGTLLRQARLQAGLSQAQLAERSGTSQSVISVYEAGLRQPSLPMLAGLIEEAGATLDIRLNSENGPYQSLASRVHAHAREIDSAAERQGVRVLGLFGSVARGEDHSGSDVDLLLDVPAGVGLFALLRLESELGELVGAEVDLVPVAGLKPDVRNNVLADLQPL